MTQGLAGNLSWNIAFKDSFEATVNGKLFYPIDPCHFHCTTDYLALGIVNSHPQNNQKWIRAGWLSGRLPVVPDSGTQFYTGLEVFRKPVSFGHLNLIDLGRLMRIEQGTRARFDWQFTLYFPTWLWGCDVEAYWYDGDEPELSQIKLDELSQPLSPQP